MNTTVAELSNEPIKAINTIPSGIKYYLLDWKDRNIDLYMRIFKDKKLNQLTSPEISVLYKIASNGDKKLLDNYN